MNTDLASQLWNDTTLLLSRDLSRNHSSMSALFSSLVPVDVSEDELVLSTPSLYTKDWVERRLANDINEAIWSVSGKHYAFRIIVQEDSLSPLAKAVPEPALPQTEAPAATQPPVSIPDAAEGLEIPALPVDDDSPAPAQGGAPYLGRTFESFVVGDANQLAFSMALHVAKAPGYIMNPLFIYGKSGLGKTHLMLSIRHYIHQSSPDLNVVYAQTNELISEFSQSARMGDFNDFNHKYYSADVFLLDDVQSLERRYETTNTVFEIFNRLRNSDKQVVLSADRAPNEIDLHERFLSRFNSGVIADVQPPSYETKLTIFNNYLDYCCRRFAREDVRMLIRPDVAEYIVSLSGSNIRELEGAATNLIWTLAADGNGRYTPITTEEALRIVGNHFRRLDAKDLSISAIQKEAENFFGVSHADILSSKRSQDISYPRQVAMYLCRLLTSNSLPAVGKAFRKDHTAVMYAYNNIDKKRQLSTKVDNEIKELIDLIAG